MADDHKDALEAYKICSDAAQDNERSYEDDYAFATSTSGPDNVQWTAQEKASRSVVGKERPMLTLNVMPSFARQVINDIRQNRPQIKVRPADSGADIETALVFNGLIRNINQASRGDVARDTAAECAVYGGFGFYRLDIEYACDDTFDQDIRINRVINPLCIKPDPYSTRADSLDWNMAFEIDLMTPDAFKEQYPKADPVSFDMLDDKVRRDWTDGDDIVVASYWKRTKAMKPILRLTDGRAVDKALYLEVDPDTGLSMMQLDAAEGVQIHGEREIETYVVDQCILNGQEQLTEKVRWAGKYIPIIPVYGEEINLKGKRSLRSMIHRARDAQRQMNFWETAASEFVALATRAPWIGEEGTFTDPDWEQANNANIAYLEYKAGRPAPQRQPLDAGSAIGPISEALRANDRLKQILGIYNASLGAESNETSGKAINARKVEGDVANFHFTDNVTRAIECEGTMHLDLIPKVYTKGRIARVLGEDGVTQDVRLGQRMIPERPAQPGQEPNPPKIGSLNGVYDLTAGKYDLTVEAGPSYTTQRAETAAIVGELIRANPEMMQIGGDIMVDNLDLKNGPELARRMKKMLPPQLQENGEQQIPPQVQQQMQAMEQALAECQAELEKERSANLKGAGEVKKAEVESAKLDIERARIPIDADQARREVLVAERELIAAQAQANATIAESGAAVGEKQASTAVLNEFAAAASLLTQAAVTLSDAAKSVAVPKRKRTVLQKVDGRWVGDQVEMPEQAPVM